MTIRASRASVGWFIGVVAGILLGVLVVAIKKISIKERQDQYEARVESALRPLFEREGVQYPPAHVTLLYLKDQNEIHLYAGRNENETQYLKTYSVLAVSGDGGPKLHADDDQIPEGVYTIEAMIPNSRYHLALKINYPNSFDVRNAKADGRTDIATDILIHGSTLAKNSIAIGDSAIEDLFVLATKTTPSTWRLIFSPTDFRTHTRNDSPNPPAWLSELDQKLLREFLTLP